MNKKTLLIIVNILSALGIAAIFTWTKQMIEVAVFFAIWGFIMKGIISNDN